MSNTSQRRSRSRRFGRPKTQGRISEINVTPLIDLAFALLIIFMIAAPMMEQSIRIDLPEQSTWQTTGEKAFLDRAQESGSSCILFDTDPPNWLRERLRELGYPVVSLNSFSRGGLPSEGDFLQVMENNLATLQDGLSR